jgi:poly(3-hydroxybutyrate) depolymerase
MRGPDDAGNVNVDLGGGGGSVADSGGTLVDSGAPSSRPSGPSAGCAAPAALADTPGKWVMHTISVSGVAPGFLPGGANYGTQAGYDFTRRNYFLKLPAKYDPKRTYPLAFSGSGCGATNGISGNNGGSNALPDNQDFAIQVGLSYVYPQKAGACFADGFSDTPDLPYFDAVLAEVKKNTCVDQAQVFMSGFSSGAWETYMLACARAGVIRGVGTQAGGLRSVRPPCSGVPVAAFLTAGTNDANPIHNVDSKSGFDSGSAPARDVILKTNGCTGTETAPYTNPNAPAGWNCHSYTSCPKAYPVIWCEIPGGHGAGSPSAFWPFWSMLPPP